MYIVMMSTYIAIAFFLTIIFLSSVHSVLLSLSPVDSRCTAPLVLCHPSFVIESVLISAMYSALVQILLTLSHPPFLYKDSEKVVTVG